MSCSVSMGGLHSGGQLLLDEVANLRGFDIARDKGLADTAHKDEGELAALHLLVLGHEIHQRVRIGAKLRHVAEAGWKPDRRQMMRNASGIVRRHETQPCGELERAGNAESDRLAVQQ